MAKYNIDDILNELGIGDEGDKAAKGRQRRHSLDHAPSTFSPLPSMPANQRTFGNEGTTEADPAVPNRAPATPATGVGSALTDFYDPAQEETQAAPQDVGEILFKAGVITGERLANAQQVIKTTQGKRIEDVLLEQGVDETAVIEAVAKASSLGFERIDLNKGLDGGFDGKILQRLGFEYCKANFIVPLRTEGRRLILGTPKPDTVFLLDEIRQKLGVLSVKLVLVPISDARAVFEIVGEHKEDENQVDVSSILAEVTEGDVQVEKSKAEEVDLAEAAGSPVIKYVNHIIQMAVKEGASDIHIEPAEKKLKVRFRIDGELYEMLNPPASMAAAITSRLKIMANLDISERRLPQDGRIRVVVGGRKLDLRMSTLPNGWGEKTVMRILDQKAISVTLDQLGFDEDTYTLWKKQVDAPHGIVLVTGPTGSGKTTTLYASLKQLDKNSMNISTVEDPVEYHLDGVTQTQMHEKIGMTFAMALRALLRQDPDVIMLGEIRDMETAHIAVQAALTGHLVLSTLHTNDAPSSITRLVNIGLEPFLVGAAVNGVLAQRLIRRLCIQCKVQEPPSEEMIEYLQLQGFPTDQMWVAKGCEKCRKSGYSGRVGIYELLIVDDQLRDIIARNPNVAEFRRLCMERGMVTLRADGMRKVGKGLTTIQEVLRVTEANQ